MEITINNQNEQDYIRKEYFNKMIDLRKMFVGYGRWLEQHNIKGQGSIETYELVRKTLKEKGIDTRVVSMPSLEVFDKQSKEYKELILPNACRNRIAVEALTSFGWHRYVGLDGEVISLDHFGESAPADKLFKKFGFTVENVVEKALSLVK
jgi:transketolase